jgi:hypothetical protein
MKKGIVILGMLVFLSSCNKSDEKIIANTNIVGSWKLIEVLSDPGDLSGTFVSVNSSKTITLSNTGKINSNGSLCNMSIESNTKSSGTFSETNSTIHPSNCQNSKIMYELNDNTLVLMYPCIEPCKEKYIKIQ